MSKSSGQPTGVALDGVGNLYVADARNARVKKLSPTGQRLALWVSDGTTPHGTDR